jgi:DNA-directed RNA polymerase subunit RPC12/RpoP
MQPLDGNAIAGKMYEHFGREMTTAAGVCGHCGARGQIAELVVYARAPGTVVRCPSCGNVVIVIARSSIHLDHFALSEGTIADK